MACSEFSSSEEVRELIQLGQAELFAEDAHLMSDLAALRNARKPFYLTHEELERILKWKLRAQYGRQLKQRALNDNKTIQTITRAAFEIQHPDKGYETELRLNLLRSIRGVEVPVASAVLSLCFPEEYAVIDYRGWEALFGKKTNPYTVKDYIRYVNVVRELANNYQVTVKDMDTAIWQMHKRQGEKKVNQLFGAQEEHLLAISAEEYQELLELYLKGKKQGVNSDAFSQFHEKLYILGIIFNFDWMNWEEGRHAFNKPDFDYSNLSPTELSKHLTAIFRADRFSDGTIEKALNRGVLDVLIGGLTNQGSLVRSL